MLNPRVIATITSSPILSTIVASVIAGLIIEFVRRRHREKEDARKWYGEALGMLSNLQQAAKKATIYRNGVNYQTLKSELSPLDQEMMRHANDAPKRVPDVARIELAVIAAYTTGLASLTEKTAETDALNFVKVVQQEAIESYDGDYDMDDLESLFSDFDFNTFAERSDRDVEINDELANRLQSRFNEESLEAGRPATIEEALEIPVEEVKDAFETEGFMNTVVDDALEAFVEMIVGWGEEIHENMESRRDSS